MNIQNIIHYTKHMTEEGFSGRTSIDQYHTSQYIHTSTCTHVHTVHAKSCSHTHMFVLSMCAH